MAKEPIAEQVKRIVQPIIESRQLEFVDVEFKREGKNRYLRIFIDTPGGVTIDDCQNVSRECEVVLDVEDIITAQYILEVSSPGLDRPLKTQDDYRRFQDHLVKIKTFQTIRGRKKFIGYLQGLTAEEPDTPAVVTLVSQEGQTVQIPYHLIASARLEVEFSNL